MLEDILLTILTKCEWISLIYVEIDCSVINPNIKELSVRKYLRNAGFVKSSIYPNGNVYFFRWIDAKTGYPIFRKDICRLLLCMFSSGSKIIQSKPYIADEIFDAKEFNYEESGIRTYQASKYLQEYILPIANISSAMYSQEYNIPIANTILPCFNELLRSLDNNNGD